ncbi:hypothetical protein BC830DRAFT_276505 [Chytriomyces sp. MP71]|nr:hypothetical protein BC830DRAFT_276505 [Chytriomyces sp. MP71]
MNEIKSLLRWDEPKLFCIHLPAAYETAVFPPHFSKMNTLSLLSSGLASHFSLLPDQLLPPVSVNLNLSLAICQSHSSNDSTVKSDDAFASLEGFMKARGAEFPKMELVTYGEYDEFRGVQASHHIKENDVIMSIPEHFLLTEKVAMDSEVGKRVQAALPEIYTNDEEHLFISLFLLQERAKGPMSAWSKYFPTLPTDYTNMDPHFGEEEVKFLRESYLYEDVYSSDVEELKESYKAVCDVMSDFCEQHSYDDYVWARLSVRTRLFSVDIDGVLRCAMVPYADMFNHEYDNVASWRFDDATRRFQIYAVKPIAPGETIHISYGEESNRKFLINYGFTFPNNPDGSAEVVVALKHGDSPDVKAKRVAKSGYEATVDRAISFQVPSKAGQEDFYAPLHLARVAVALPDELELLAAKGASIVSLRCEKAAWLLYQESVLDALRVTPSTKEADEALLANESLSWNVRNIIRVRHSEREAALKIMGLIDLFLTLVESSQEDFNLLRANPKFDEVQDYVQQVAEAHRSEFSKSLLR